MIGLRLLEVHSRVSSGMKTRVPKVAVEISRGCRLTLKCSETFGRYAKSLSRFKLEEQLCFVAKINIMCMINAK